jgi:signal transduction histidine kinase
MDWTYIRQQSWRAYYGYERRESAETDADLRQHHAGVGVLARMAAVRRLHPCSVKSCAHELYSPRLQYLDIAGVMRSFCKEFGERRKVQVDFKSHDLPDLVMPDITLCLFRVLQEALHNAVK